MPSPLALALAVSALAAAGLAPAPAAISPEEAAVRAVNSWSAAGDRLVLRQPRSTVEFAPEGVRFAPRRGPVWRWSLGAVEVGGAALPGLALAASPRADGLVARYDRGALVEEYVARTNGVEQRFVLPRPLPAGGDLALVGRVASAGSFEPLAQGWHWRDESGAVTLGQVLAYDATGTALPATMEVTATSTRIVLDGAALASARYPVTIDPEIGANDFRISDVGGTGDADFDATNVAVAYNSTDNEYLVVWSADDNVGGLVDGEDEIFGQRLDAATGAEIGTNDFRISDAGDTGNTTYRAVTPAAAYNPTNNEYLVVWVGSDNVGGLVVNEFETFGQRLDAATGAEVGGNDFRISDMGGTGNADYSADWVAVAYNSTDNEYLMVWSGDDNVGGLVDNEREIFGQRLNAATGTELGSNDFRISDMGGTGDPSFGAFVPDVDYTPAANGYLVAWMGDDNVGGLVDEEYEIFGQRLNALGGELGPNDFRISDMGGTGNTTYAASLPSLVFNAGHGGFLVVWLGDDDVGGLSNDELEIFGEFIGPAGTIGPSDFRLSDMGGIGQNPFDAQSPAAAYADGVDEFLVVWTGDDDVGGLVDDELEAFGQRLIGDPFFIFADGFESGDTDAWDTTLD